MTTISATKPGRKGGRPKLMTEEVRKPCGVRLSELERLEVRQRADEAGLDFSVYCRNAILNSDAPRVVPTINREAWLKLSALTPNEFAKQLALEKKAAQGQTSTQGLSLKPEGT